MKLTDYFQLTIEERIAREENKTPTEKVAQYTIEDYYETGDSISFLEKLRTYQLNDIMSRRSITKYKLF